MSKVPTESTSTTTNFTPSIDSDQETAKDASTSNSVIRLESSVPWASSDFIIRDAASEKVLIFQKGDIRLGDVGGNYTYRWRCVEKDGWFGFRDPASHMFLGHDHQGIIRCQAGHHRAWEEFCMRSVPSGGYNLLVKHYNQLRLVGLEQPKVPDSIWVTIEKSGLSMAEQVKDKTWLRWRTGLMQSYGSSSRSRLLYRGSAVQGLSSSKMYPAWLGFPSGAREISFEYSLTLSKRRLLHSRSGLVLNTQPDR